MRDGGMSRIDGDNQVIGVGKFSIARFPKEFDTDPTTGAIALRLCGAAKSSKW